jgi:HK97 family phage major capsid protein
MNNSRVALLARIERRLNQPTFSREDSSWVDASLKTIELLGREGFPEGADAHCEEVDAFFRARDVSSPLIDSLHLRKGGTAVQLRTAMNEGTASAGGDLVPIGFYNDVVLAMKAYDGIFDAGRRVYTKTGNVLHLPSADDTNNVAEIVSENGPVSQLNATYGEAVFSETPLWSSKQVIVTKQLLDDSGIDIPGHFAKIFGQRFARGIGASFLTTLLSGVATGVTTASATAITGDELINLLGSLDAMYAMSPRCGWLMSLASLLYILKLKDGAQRYQFQPIETDEAGHVLLLGRPVYICPNMPGVTAGNKSVIVGDMDYFVIREAGERMSFIRYDEIYMINHMVGFQAFCRTDAALVTPVSGSAPPLVALVQHS